MNKSWSLCLSQFKKQLANLFNEYLHNDDCPSDYIKLTPVHYVTEPKSESHNEIRTKSNQIHSIRRKCGSFYSHIHRVVLLLLLFLKPILYSPRHLAARNGHTNAKRESDVKDVPCLNNFAVSLYWLFIFSNECCLS